MARPVRIEIAGGWSHVMARGNDRRRIFVDDKDRRQFVELLGEWVERFGLRLHAYVLMENHYHLLVETPEANLSRAMQWLGVSYTMWFNRRHQRAGHLFQGRFTAMVLEAESAAVEVSRYLHLNPVRVAGLGLRRADQQRSRAGLVGPPAAAVVTQRLEQLRQYPWSSYRAYVGRGKAASWLTRKAVLELAGGRRADQAANYQRYVELAVREGVVESPWERLEAGLVLGGREFVARLRARLRGDDREQPQLRRLTVRPSWAQVVAVVEGLKGQRWDQFCEQHGDWGRDVALYLGRRAGRMTLRELAGKAGGIDYVSVATAVRRISHRLAHDKQLAALTNQAQKQLHNK